MVRQKIALIVFATVALTIAAMAILTTACRQVPSNTLDTNKPAPDRPSEKSFDPKGTIDDAENAFQTTPRTPARVKTSAEMYAKALEHPEIREYDHLWKAARVATWLGEYLTDDAEREKYAREGLTWVNTALKRDPEGKEAIFYRAVLAGFLGDLDNSYGLDAVSVIRENMEKLIEADFDIAHGGPWRAYGVLLVRAPGPPTSIGSLRNARRILNGMLEKAPDWPENHLYYAEFEFEWGDDKDDPDFARSARERLDKYLLGENAKPPEGYETEFKHWQADARALLDEHGE